MGNKTVYDYEHYTFEADQDTISRIKKDDKFSGGMKKGNAEFYAKSDEGLQVFIYSADKNTELASVYFHGKRCAETGAFYRRMTMENNDAKVENKVNENNEQGRQVKEVTFKELNFERDVVGSDETGKSETFKELIVVAVYVRPGKEHMDALLKLNVNDSKKMDKNRLNEVGKELSRMSEKLSADKPYSDFQKKLGEKDGAWIIETDHLIFCVTAYSNKRYNSDRKNTNILLKDLHGKVIEKLFKHIKGDEKTCIVVDDFFGKDENRRMDFVMELNKLGHPQKAFVEKADAKVIAVSCASIISAYLQNLHLDELANEYGLLYDDIFANAMKADIYDDVKKGTFCLKEEKSLTKSQRDYYEKLEAFMEKLKNKGDNVLTEFFDKYAKLPKEEK